MADNPELHYLEHVQNTSISKHCCRFAKAQRFLSLKKTSTDFNYHPSHPYKNRSCNFGYGKRVDLTRQTASPGPNTYNVSKFPINKRSTSLGYSRDQATFGSIGTQITMKSKLPSPGAYPLPSSIKSSNFTIKPRLPTQIQIRLKNKVPGPGQYEAPGINNRGRFPSSKFKNVRFIIMDGLKKTPQRKQSEVGPGSYDLFNSESKYSESKVEQMRHTTAKLFGTDKRKGPEYTHKRFIPGPGMYDTFSTFGESCAKFRSRTEY